MSDIDILPEDAQIPLSEMIETLRFELQKSIQQGAGKRVAFDIDKVELELKVAIARSAKGDGGVAFWVVKAGGAVEGSHETNHTFKLTLLPVDATTGQRLKVSAQGAAAPPRN